ncbi:Gfo/Idh/MocA family oxidoreductase [Halogeometricum sp. S1BR25-6]|uniref:Gfo/Idh/MocA family oxidoreductase n=1 Tax=Halogeometricum salsisoli TaxID=2950536 RepID=A0ABU2GIH8_9EURY|nr:Gfo/Idh/MocA family oxidoreductase [Halogeometricum sp. S1BR25-6]MDS0300584.1 Gfo/Idh/MocA family oxidoreductase [Halogeometricum sp. S1BR25-6]
MQEIGIIMNGVTGRMGTNQHLIRSILALREEGGVELPSGERVVPDPLLVGRNERKLRELSEEHGVERWAADPDLETCLDGDDEIYFDSQITPRRPDGLLKAMEAGKDVYCEKPLASDLDTALELARAAEEHGVKHGIVQDKLWLPGLMKLQRLIDQDFFGDILSVRVEFGYWVFPGQVQTAQRPSWNYRAEDGGGIVDDMFSHWSYVLESLFGGIETVRCLQKTHIDERIDESGDAYEATADDAAYAIMELEDDVVAQLNSSWTVRVNRDDLLEIQVDGTEGSAVAGLRDCKTQHRSNTPKPEWNPDTPKEHDFYDDWTGVPNNQEFENAFKVQWEKFIRHVVADEPFDRDFSAGARGVQLTEAAYRSSEEGRRVVLDEFEG